MTEVTEASGDILEGVEEIAGGVAQVALGFSGLALTSSFLVGTGVGGAVAYFVTRRMLETKYANQAADEISGMREHYARKEVALENDRGKGTVEALIREKGYDGSREAAAPSTGSPPMAVEPPAKVVEAATVEEPMPGVRVEVAEASDEVEETKSIFPDSSTDYEWDEHKERTSRSPLAPFVINRSERDKSETAEEITLTYFEEDDVLCNESDEILDKTKRDEMVGEANLNRFGHGSDDRNVVFVRNPVLEIDFEIVRSPNSYAEEVAGFAPDPPETTLKHSARERRSLHDE